jgi:xanthosine utilization system XapX-like protein
MKHVLSATVGVTDSKNRKRYAVSACIHALVFLIALSHASARANQQPTDLPSVSDSIIIDGMRVTLLDARRLSAEEYRLSGGNTPDLWAGGGFHFAFLVENRPGQPIPAVLGEIRVLIGSQLYNSVTNATSSKPFAPYVVFQDVEKFFNGTVYGRSIPKPMRPRPGATAGVVEIFIRGGVVPGSTTCAVELEQGATHLTEQQALDRPIRADDVAYHWFRFRLPKLD